MLAAEGREARVHAEHETVSSAFHFDELTQRVCLQEFHFS